MSEKSELEVARETNKRLNRRLGELEKPYSNEINKLQRELTNSLKLVAEILNEKARVEQTLDKLRQTQRDNHYVFLIVGWLFLFVTAWAGISTFAAVAVWYYFH